MSQANPSMKVSYGGGGWVVDCAEGIGSGRQTVAFHGAAQLLVDQAVRNARHVKVLGVVGQQLLEQVREGVKIILDEIVKVKVDVHDLLQALVFGLRHGLGFPLGHSQKFVGQQQDTSDAGGVYAGFVHKKVLRAPEQYSHRVSG
jgi:hypothetical protein